MISINGSREAVPTDFTVLRREPTRWADNDHYSHVNNVVYYSLFDSAVNGWLIAATGVDIRTLPAIGVVAETSCRYLRELSFPDVTHVGIGLERLGTTSVTYRLALFSEDADGSIRTQPHALGRFVHVYIDTATRRPTPVPEVIRTALSLLSSTAGPALAAPKEETPR